MLTLWRTTHALPTLAAEVNRLMNDVALTTPAFSATGLTPPADILETVHEFRVVIDLPGVDPASIKLSVEKDTLQAVIASASQPKVCAPVCLARLNA